MFEAPLQGHGRKGIRWHTRKLISCFYCAPALVFRFPVLFHKWPLDESLKSIFTSAMLAHAADQVLAISPVIYVVIEGAKIATISGPVCTRAAPQKGLEFHTPHTTVGAAKGSFQLGCSCCNSVPFSENLRCYYAENSNHGTCREVLVLKGSNNI